MSKHSNLTPKHTKALVTDVEPAVTIWQRRRPQIAYVAIGSAALLLIMVMIFRSSALTGKFIPVSLASATLTDSAVQQPDAAATNGSYVLFNESNEPPTPTPTPPPGGDGVGGSGADMTPGRKCAAGTAGATTISGGDLGSAVAALTDGGTLVVDGGTYGMVNIDNRANLTICGKPGTRPVITMPGGDSYNNGFVITNSSNIHIEGFEISGKNGTNEAGIRVGANSHHIHIWDNWVHDLGSLGIGAANGYCGHIDFRYNRVWNTAQFEMYHTSGIAIYEPRNCGGGADVGIYSDFIIGNIGYLNGERIGGASDGNCIIYDDTLDRQGINHSEGAYNGRVLIANNVCVANGGRGVHVGPTSARADVVNNTDYMNFNPAFTVPDADKAEVGQMDSGYQSEDVRFINNVSIARSGKNGFDHADGSNIISANNIFYPVTRDGGVGGYQSIADPGFTSPGENPIIANFRPRSGSPMINAGIGSYANIIIPKVDVTGKARSLTTPSIGAYEP